MNTLYDLSGVLILNKHIGVTSHDIVNRIRHLYNSKRVGHTGTLDPLANGVLPILIGRAAKAAEFLTGDDKQYVATMRLGITTDTEDITGKILTETTLIPNELQVYEVVKKFIGNISQIPPMYSALKINGRKLVDIARKGGVIEREARHITIHNINIETIDEELGEYKLDVQCTKGTYIRTLCADIGAMLGCGGIMSELTRTQSGTFKIEDSFTIDYLEKISYEDRTSILLPIEKLFKNLDKIILDRFFARLAHCGAEIYQQKIGVDYPLGKRLALYDEKGFFAIGEVMEFEDQIAIKPIKHFVLDY